MLADAGWRLESDTWSSRVLRFFGCHSFGEATALGSESVSSSLRRNDASFARPTEPRIRGHRFSGSRTSSYSAPPPAALPQSPRDSRESTADDEVPAAPPVPPPDAPRVLLLDPGSGDACEALQGCFRVYLAVDPSYDIQAAALPRPPHSLSRRTSVFSRMHSHTAATDTGDSAVSPAPAAAPTLETSRLVYA